MKWHDLGIELLDSNDVGELNTIETEHPSDLNKCCTKMFDLWLKKQLTVSSWLSRRSLQSHIRLISHDAECFVHAYNASSLLVSSGKGTFVEISKARLVTQVGMVNLFRLNGMETQGFLSAKAPALFRSTGPAV